MIQIQRKDGSLAQAKYAKHLRTLTATNSCGGGNIDVDLYLLPDGTEIECTCPANDGRAVPCEVESGSYS